MNPNKAYVCLNCGEKNPKDIDETDQGLLHVQQQPHISSLGSKEYEWVLCGEVKLDILASFRNLIEQHKDQI